jgi:hypothetical protein
MRQPAGRASPLDCIDGDSHFAHGGILTGYPSSSLLNFQELLKTEKAA